MSSRSEGGATARVDSPPVGTFSRLGAAAYGLSWSDAHLWAYAEVHGLPEILSE